MQSVNYLPIKCCCHCRVMTALRRLWNAKTGSELFVFRVTQLGEGCQLLVDGRRIITASFDGTARRKIIKTGIEQLS